MNRVQLSGAEAMELLRRGEDATEARDWPVVAACYEEFLNAFPDTPISPELWFDAALAHKFLRNWPKAYELGRQAVLRAGEPEGNPAWWNLGIAATMVGDWGTARQAWSGYGVPLTPGEGEIEDGFGSALVRLDPDGDAEVVWVRRICPTRARVLSVPYGMRRFGEIVVHDGAATGERRVDDQTFPVFDELALWQASATPTWRARVSAPGPWDLADLANAFDERGLAMEPLDDAAPAGTRNVLLASPDEQTATGILTQWAIAGAERSWHTIHAKARTGG